jgi:hypothetical protein
VTDANDYFVGDTQEEVNDEIGAAQEVPTDLTADFYLFGTTSATLNWGVSNDNRITGYRLYQADYPGDFATVYDFATSTNTYTVTGLEYDHDYQFKVVSTDGVTESDNMSKIVVHVREDAGGADTASEVAVEDTEENFTGEDVEAVLAEIKDELDGITPTLSIIELTGTTSLTADQLTNSRIFLGHSALATYTFASAQDAYELGEPVTVFIFTTTNPADFDCQAGDKITYVAGEKTTMDDGDKMSAVSPELYDSFVVTPIKIGADYQWLINCVSGDYEDGGP